MATATAIPRATATIAIHHAASTAAITAQAAVTCTRHHAAPSGSQPVHVAQLSKFQQQRFTFRLSTHEKTAKTTRMATTICTTTTGTPGTEGDSTAWSSFTAQ